MRALINEKIADGAPDEEIFDFFAARYGVGILRDPPKQGLALGVWLGPIIAAAAGVLTVGVVLLRRRPRPVPRPDARLRELEGPDRPIAASTERRPRVTPVVLLVALAARCPWRIDLGHVAAAARHGPSRPSTPQEAQR